MEDQPDTTLKGFSTERAPWGAAGTHRKLLCADQITRTPEATAEKEVQGRKSVSGGYKLAMTLQGGRSKRLPERRITATSERFPSDPATALLGVRSTALDPYEEERPALHSHQSTVCKDQDGSN